MSDAPMDEAEDAEAAEAAEGAEGAEGAELEDLTPEGESADEVTGGATGSHLK